MKCKNHPDREASHFCASCGIPICPDCVEEAKPGEYCCFQCAVLASLSQVGRTIRDKKEKLEEAKRKEKNKITPFQHFVIVSSAVIAVMWGVILFAGVEPPPEIADLAGQPRVLLFMVDGAIKKYAHYEGNHYPAQLSALIPTYLNLEKQEATILTMLSYVNAPDEGYRLSLSEAASGEDMKIVITPNGITYGDS